MGHNGTKLSNLFKDPLVNWQTATQQFEYHEKTSLVHHDSMLHLAQFDDVMSGRTKGIALCRRREKIILLIRSAICIDSNLRSHFLITSPRLNPVSPLRCATFTEVFTLFLAISFTARKSTGKRKS